MTTRNGTQDAATAHVPKLVLIELDRFKASFQPGVVALLPFTVLIGRNGSGKSTLVEALQWIDATLRRDAVEACKRYFGVHDLVNLRSQAAQLFFAIGLEWELAGKRWRYRVKVNEDADGITPHLVEEELSTGAKRAKQTVLSGPESPDRLALWRAPFCQDA